MDRRSEAERRESFEQINASAAIEGVSLDALDREWQERIIRGEVTHEEAIAEIVRQARGGR